MELYTKEKINNFGVIELIDIPKKLINVHIHTDYSHISYSNNPNITNPFNKILENSLMKHAQIIQYFKDKWTTHFKNPYNFCKFKRTRIGW